jgi:hypothetical protein
MNIPGTNVENPPAGQELDPNAPQPEGQDDDADLIETATVGGQRMVPVAELIRVRKESKAAKRELDSLRPQIERANQVSAQLEQLQPVLEQFQRMTPQQREALASGRLESPSGTPHNAEDVEARELASDYGLISQDGSLDIARARKILDRNAEKVAQEVQRHVAPLRQSSAQQQAAVIRQQAMGITDKNGEVLATPESIQEAYAMLPAELAAQPNVAAVALGTAMLIDRMKGRVVKPAQQYSAPMYSEPSGRRSGSSITAEDRAIAAKVGLTDKDLTAAASAISQSGRGVRME